MKILIVEDEYPIALDIEITLRKRGYDIVGIAPNYNKAIQLLSSYNVDLVLLDINLESDKSGLDIAREINSKYEAPIVFLTAYSDKRTFDKALELSPSGFISKPFKEVDVVNTIEIAFKQFQRKTVSEEKQSYPYELSLLTGREKEILVCLSKGLKDKEIGEYLFISITTVRTHLRNIYSKLSTRNRVETIQFIGESNL